MKIFIFSVMIGLSASFAHAQFQKENQGKGPVTTKPQVKSDHHCPGFYDAEQINSVVNAGQYGDDWHVVFKHNCTDSEYPLCRPVNVPNIFPYNTIYYHLGIQWEEHVKGDARWCTYTLSGIPFEQDEMSITVGKFRMLHRPR